MNVVHASPVSVSRCEQLVFAKRVRRAGRPTWVVSFCGAFFRVVLITVQGASTLYAVNCMYCAGELMCLSIFDLTESGP